MCREVSSDRFPARAVARAAAGGRLHGAGGGAPPGPRHPNYRHGLRSAENLCIRRLAVYLSMGAGDTWSLTINDGGSCNLPDGYYVIAAWTLAYIVKAANSFGGATVASVAQQFDELKASPGTLIIWHTVFISLALFIVGRGLRRGIEGAAKF